MNINPQRRLYYTTPRVILQGGIPNFSRLSSTAISNLMLTNRQYESITMGDIAAPTGIAEVNAAENDAPAYNIQGIRSKLNTRGIVIQNGKKYVNK